MQRILDLIEATLDAEVTPAELAEMSGYSLWHFLHLFTREVGMPLERYRTRRRLAHAIWHISRGMGVTDAALRWGFGTHSGFYRAFQKEYGTSPTQWLRTHRVPAPVVPLIKEEVFRMLNREKFREALSHWGDAQDLRWRHSRTTCGLCRFTRVGSVACGRIGRHSGSVRTVKPRWNLRCWSPCFWR